MHRDNDVQHHSGQRGHILSVVGAAQHQPSEECMHPLVGIPCSVRDVRESRAEKDIYQNHAGSPITQAVR